MGARDNAVRGWLRHTRHVNHDLGGLSRYKAVRAGAHRTRTGGPARVAAFAAPLDRLPWALPRLHTDWSHRHGNCPQ